MTRVSPSTQARVNTEHHTSERNEAQRHNEDVFETAPLRRTKSAPGLLKRTDELPAFFEDFVDALPDELFSALPPEVWQRLYFSKSPEVHSSLLMILKEPNLWNTARLQALERVYAS